jgi:hypothetical protein
MRLRSLLTPLALASLAACTLPTQPTTNTRSAIPAGGPYSAGPVLLQIDGSGDGHCRFDLNALYPADLEPHVVAIDYQFTSRRSGESVGSGGMYVELPMSGGLTQSTAAGLLTPLAGYSTDEPCSGIEATVQIKECERGKCPAYVAGEGTLPMALQVSTD